MTVVCSFRLRGRDAKTGIVKVQFSCKDDKIKVSRQKRKLKDSTIFRRTYMRTSKFRIECLIDINFKTISREPPGGDSFPYHRKWTGRKDEGAGTGKPGVTVPTREWRRHGSE